MIPVIEPEIKTGSELSNLDSQLTHATYYKNLTGETVTIVHRNGYNETIYPASAANRGHVLVTIVRSGNRDVCYNAVANDSSQSRALSRLYREHLEKGDGSGKLEYTYRINRKEITKEGVYVPDLDIVITKGVPSTPVIHPYSNKAAILSGAFQRDGAGVTMSLFSVDHDRRSGREGYVSAFGVAANIKNQHHDMLGSGVYVTLSDGTGEARVIHHTKDSEVLKIHDSADEALKSGVGAQTDDVIKRQIAELKLREAQSQSEISQLKAKLEFEGKRFDHELKSATARMASELDAAELRNKELSAEVTRLRAQIDAERSDKYEQGSHNRKASMEYIKIVPAVLSLASSAMKG